MDNKLGFHKVCVRWIPKQIIEVHKTCVDNCQKHLDRYGNEQDIFLDRIITGDKTWVLHYEPENKRQNTEWKHPHSPCKKKFKTQPSTGKLMPTEFWDSQGPVLEHYQERSTTMNSARTVRCWQAKPAIRSKCQGLPLYKYEHILIPFAPTPTNTQINRIVERCCVVAQQCLSLLLQCSGNSRLK